MGKMISGRELLARVICKLNEYAVEMPDGCPHCGFQLAKTDDYDECPWCGWSDDTEPERSPEEAREKFLREANPFSR